MPLISAKKIHDGVRWLPAGSSIAMDESGCITGIVAPGATPDRFYDGILTPGFVNAHCHLELSHLKGVIPKETGMVGFLLEVMQQRQNFSEDHKREARLAAAADMYRQGISAVGDIANTTDTIGVRLQDVLHIHTFVEATGFVPATAATRFAAAESVYQSFASQTAGKKLLGQSVVPHAPYSVSKPLLEMIDAHSSGALLSMHSQESNAEREFFMEKSGDFLRLFDAIGISLDFFSAPQISSLEYALPALAANHPVVLVHNTDTTAADIEEAKKQHPDLWWCLCPKANLYIENRLPDLTLFAAMPDRVCIGTDSLASNDGLSIAAEISLLRRVLPTLSMETLLQWACYNGAAALQMQHRVGTLQEGMQPGILQLTQHGPDGELAVNRLF